MSAMEHPVEHVTVVLFEVHGASWWSMTVNGQQWWPWLARQVPVQEAWNGYHPSAAKKLDRPRLLLQPTSLSLYFISGQGFNEIETSTGKSPWQRDSVAKIHGST